MWNRPAIFSIGLAILLMAGSAIVYLLHGDTRPDPVEHHWKITRIENGKAVASSLQREVPRDLAALFPDHSNAMRCSYLIEPSGASNVAANSNWFSSTRYSAEDQRTIEFLLLLPPAALLICIFRNVIGLPSFGIFAPALLGLAFREVETPLGVFVILTIILAGWWIRRGLNQLHLLQVPRTALLLSCIVVLLLLLRATLGNGASAIALFPLVILTGMIERFWSMEEDDGAAGSISTLASTLLMSSCVWALATIRSASSWMLAHPETLGFIMAAQVLLGRYTGFRLLELYRFRALSAQACPLMR